jgi:hypothetical protein
MGVNGTKAGRLPRHIFQTQGQHTVLQHIGMVSGMVTVTVIHNSLLKNPDKQTKAKYALGR